jgi:Ras-related protein Rab-1A
MSKYDQLFKIIIIGNSGVGKTSIMNKFADNKALSKEYISTIGVDFRVRTIVIDGQRVKLQMWDTAGQERYKTLTTTYYRNAHGIVLMYDITNADSFRQLSEWNELIEKYAPPNIPRMLIGNKSDSVIREVTTEAGSTFASANNMIFFETSVKADVNIGESFDAIAHKMMCSPTVKSTAHIVLKDTKDKKDKKIWKCSAS